jgi:hypothetical protein
VDELLGQQIMPQEHVHPLQHAAMGDNIVDDESVEQQTMPPEPVSQSVTEESQREPNYE